MPPAMVLVSLPVLAMGVAHDLVARFLGQIMMRLDGLDCAIAAAFVGRVPWSRYVRRLAVWMFADGAVSNHSFAHFILSYFAG